MPSAAARVDNHEPQETPVFDVAKQKTAHSVDAALSKMVAASKTSPLKLMRDYVGLAFGPGKISFKDYNQLRLFDSAFWAGVDRRTVAGQRHVVAIHQAINYRLDWWGLLENKIASYSYLSTYGFPVIPVLAVYSENLKTNGALVASNAQQLHRILTDEANYPMFGKPVEGLQSLGSIGLRRYLPPQKTIETQDGRLVPLDAFVDQLRTHYPTGYVLQKFLSPHAAIHALCGDRLATVRVVTLTTEAGPKVFRACWKIPAGANTADNYWRKGNLLAQIDIGQGKVLRVVSGSGLDLTQHDCHPDTKAPLIGFQIPHWQRMLDTVIEAARLMRHVPLIGWDVAALDEGPVIVEMNETPDFFLPQLADRRGILEPELMDFMAQQQHKFAEYKKSNRQSIKEF
jgi:putative polysaccharide biosynthesis protein